jgi:hypothetical protein
VRAERDEYYENCVIFYAVLRFLECRDPEAAEEADLVSVYGSLEEADRYQGLERRERESRRTCEDRLKCAKKGYR